MRQDENRTDQVDAYIRQLDHPLRAEVQALREIIKGIHPGSTERIEWNAPSFRYKDYLATFNLRARQRVHLWQVQQMYPLRQDHRRERHFFDMLTHADVRISGRSYEVRREMSVCRGARDTTVAPAAIRRWIAALTTD
jgi:hypothetical protein